MLVKPKTAFSQLFRWIFCNIEPVFGTIFIFVTFQQSFTVKFYPVNKTFRTHGTVKTLKQNFKTRFWIYSTKPPQKYFHRNFPHARFGGNVRKNGGKAKTDTNRVEFNLKSQGSTLKVKHNAFEKIGTHGRVETFDSKNIYAHIRARIYNKVDKCLFCHVLPFREIPTVNTGTETFFKNLSDDRMISLNSKRRFCPQQNRTISSRLLYLRSHLH